VRAFFRLFQSQSVNVPYQTPISNSGVSAPAGAYRQYSDGTVDGFKTPLLGISSDGSEYITVPCFATKRQPNTTVANNMTTQKDPPNIKTITPIPGQTVYIYFGCWLDNNQVVQVFLLAPGANPDGPFSGTLNTVSQIIDRGATNASSSRSSTTKPRLSTTPPPAPPTKSPSAIWPSPPSPTRDLLTRVWLRTPLRSDPPPSPSTPMRSPTSS
jgi:hypothetical protein